VPKDKSIYQSFADKNRSTVTIAKTGKAFVVTNHFAGVPIEIWCVISIGANRTDFSFHVFPTKKHANNYVRVKVNENGGQDPVHEDVNDLPF